MKVSPYPQRGDNNSFHLSLSRLCEPAWVSGETICDHRSILEPEKGQHLCAAGPQKPRPHAICSIP